VRDKSIFWHNLWMDCGRLRAGVVAESMRRTLAAYHYAIRRVKKDEDSIIRERLANCIVENKQRNFWMEIKRIRSKKSCVSRVIDGNTSDVNPCPCPYDIVLAKSLFSIDISPRTCIYILFAYH